uniref:NADH dehydrogenase subunit 6 n=1 Tax=Peregrinus maidis TaxID=222432 RepID=A0A343UJC6_9HEMI|nr:NADH dehydrogenase subunit 6 [Peregrinus maidis]AVC55504.1 NADH dehydrogenase subunit 6 [Peregrinus maidis]
MKSIQMLMIMNSFFSMTLKHPISLGSILILQSLLTTLMNLLLTKNSWYPMILFITFSSGVMIMFMYMSSISSNEKFSVSYKMMLIMILTCYFVIMINQDSLFILMNNWMEDKMTLQENEEKKSILKMLLNNKIYLTILMTLMIMLMLITVSNLTNSFEGPLKLTYDLKNQLK